VKLSGMLEYHWCIGVAVFTFALRFKISEH